MLWTLLVALSLAVLAGVERQRLIGDFTTASATLHRLASQRADQHDAHLTSLSAILVVGGPARQDLLLDVAGTILRFYPRIRSMNAIPLDAALASIETRPVLTDAVADSVRKMARISTGALEIAQMQGVPDHYLLVKRSPNTDAASYGLALVINAAALLESDDPFWGTPAAGFALLTPDGVVLTGRRAAGGAMFSKPLGSASQPLILETHLAIRPADLLPIGKALAVAVAATILYISAMLARTQRARTQAAENRARLSAQEVRLAHASRINAMGEMASGMAHELAQPLTAILAQAQAGRHLLRRGDVERLSGVLVDTVTQAQRASDILQRLRRWSRPNRAETTLCAVHDAVRGVVLLLAQEARAAGADINLVLIDAPIFVVADPVALEQVIFNLVRNALEASDAARVTLRSSVAGGRVILDVSDNGPGVPPDLQSRIFEPFVTGRVAGTGLGLALCQRLVEEMDGDIILLVGAPQTTFRVSLPQARPTEGA